MFLFKDDFNTNNFGFDNGKIKKNIHLLYKTGDSKYLNIILDSLYSEMFITYFEIPKNINKNEKKNIIGIPILYTTEENEIYLPVFTKINQLVEWKPDLNEEKSTKITNLYLNYLNEYIEKHPELNINGYIINPKSKESLIITLETLNKSNENLTSEGIKI